MLREQTALIGNLTFHTTWRSRRHKRRGAPPATGARTGRIHPLVKVAASGIIRTNAAMPAVMNGRFATSAGISPNAKKRSNAI
jgi:hypothetical protein